MARHLHLRTDSQTTCRTYAGESIAKCKREPSSSMILRESWTDQLSRSAVATNVAAGPVTNAHGSTCPQANGVGMGWKRKVGMTAQAAIGQQEREVQITAAGSRHHASGRCLALRPKSFVGNSCNTLAILHGSSAASSYEPRCIDAGAP